MLGDDKLQIIKDYTKNQPIDSYNINDSGGDNLIIIINNDRVFRFPKKINYHDIYEKEVKILDYIRSFISTNIPNTKIINEEDCNFTVHNLIKGVDFNALSLEQKNKIIPNLSKDIAKFFSEIHSIKNDFLPIENNKLEDWACYRYYDHIFDFVKKYKKTKILKRAMQKFIEISKNLKREDNAICHDDLHNGNIIVNAGTQSLVGVIDWGDVAFKNYNYDFMHLDDDLLPFVVPEYERLANRSVDVEFIEVLKRIRVFGKIGKAIFNKEEVPEKFIEKLKNMD